MLHREDSGHSLCRLSLIGLTLLSLATSSSSQGSGTERMPVFPDSIKEQDPQASTDKQVSAIKQEAELRILPTEHLVTTEEGPDPESDEPSELRKDPQPGIEGDQWAQQPIPEYLKGNPYRLSYLAGDYIPAVGERMDPALATYWKRNRNKVSKTYGFVMLQGKITTAKIKRIEALGLKLDNFHTFQCFSAVIPFSTIPALLGSPDVHWIGYAKPLHKVDPELTMKMSLMDDTERGAQKLHLFVNVYESDLGSASEFVQAWPLTEKGNDQTPVLPTQVMMSNGRFQRALEALGARVYAYHPDNKAFQLEAPYDLVQKMAALDWVHFVEPLYPVDLEHDRSTRQVAVDRVRSSTLTDGSTTVVGLLDSGAYMGTGRHKDLNKQAVGWNFNGGLGSIFSETYGHGTHVLGTIGGTGTADSRYKGCAPAIGSSYTTRVFVGKIGGTSTVSTYPNNTLAAFTQFHKDYTDIRRLKTPYPHVVNCSWGYGSRAAAGYTGTDNISLAVDTQSHQYGQLYVFSASNTGGSPSAQYLRSMRRPNVSKNALTVASCFDYRGTLGTSAFEPGKPSWSSGKGPTLDGRFKPNIMAPGDSIRSCKTQTQSGYINKAGTSMAAPHVAGIAAGLMDHRSNFKRNPPLTKAMLAAQTNPYRGSRSWISSSDSYYYRQGLGQIDAYKANWSSNTSKGWMSGYATGTMDYRTAGASFDVTIPSDGKHALFVLNFDEKAASPGAKRAVIADVDLYLDVAPFTAGYNTGEYSSRRAYDTWEWYDNIKTIAALRGKTVRIKIYPRVRPTFGSKVKWAVAYQIPRGPNYSTHQVSGTLALSASSGYVRPGGLLNLTATVNVPSWVQTNSLVELYSTGGFSVVALKHKSVDRLARTYTTTTIPGIGDSLFNWTLGNIPYFAVSGQNNLIWQLRRSAAGYGTVCVRLRSDNRPNSSTYSRCVTLCVDGTSPNSITGITSKTHPRGTWRNLSTASIAWRTPSDVGCAGIAGLAATFTTSSTSVPRTMNIKGSAITLSTRLGSTSGLYFHIRGVDRAGNLSAKTSHYGPIRVDLTRPLIKSFSINRTAPYTRSLRVAVAVTATDTYSGTSMMRFSSDAKTWSPWTTYTTKEQTYDLSALGGSKGQGTKYVYAEVRDLAGNISALTRDTIIYDTISPVLSSVKINNGVAHTRSTSLSVGVSGSGASHIQYSLNRITWSPLMVFAPTRPISMSSYGGNTNQGIKTVYVRLRDLAGNYSITKDDTINYDSIAPVVTKIHINANAPYTRSLNASISVVATDTSSGPYMMRFSSNGTTWSPTRTYSTAAQAYSLGSYGGNTAQGLKRVYVVVYDRAGNVSAAASDTILYDSVPPVLSSVVINGGASYTRSLILGVKIVGTGASYIQYSFNGTIWTSLFRYSPNPLTLRANSYGGNTNQGTKTIYVRLRDSSGNYSATKTDSIVYDTIAPIVKKVHINGNAIYTRSLKTMVAISAIDATSGPARMRFSSNGSTWTPLRNYSIAVQPYVLSSYGGNTAQGLKRVYVQVVDHAGNSSTLASDTIIYDSIAPVLSSVVLNNGAVYMKSLLVGAKLVGSGASHMQYSFNGTTWSGLQTYKTSVSLWSNTYGGNSNQGLKTCYVRLRDLAGNYSAIKSDTIIYDSIAPKISVVRINNGAAYTNNLNVSVHIVATGSPRLAQFSFNGTTWSPWAKYTTGAYSMSASSYGGNTNQGIKTVYARLLDSASNLSAIVRDSIIYDSTAPVISQVQINGGGAYTSSTNVTVQVLGTGMPTQVQYSFDGSTWSAWISYTTGARTLNIASYGGSANVGTKKVYARLRDAALNNSVIKTDSIVYLKVPNHRPVIGSIFTVIHDKKIALTGTGLGSVNRVYIGTNLIASTSPDDWHKGWFRILGDTSMEIYPPQNMAPGTYNCYVRNAGFRGPNFTVRVTHNKVSKTGVPTVLKSGKVLHVYTARGPKPATTYSILTFSISGKPLILPGLVSLGHGGNTTTYIDPSFTLITPGQGHNATTRTAHWAFPTPPGKISGPIYWQSIMFDTTNLTQTPIPVSTTDVVKFYK